MYKKYFYFKSSQRRGVIVLLILIFIFALSPLLFKYFQSKSIAPVDYESYRAKLFKLQLANIDTLHFEKFNINEQSYYDLIKLGFSKLQASEILCVKENLGKYSNYSELDSVRSISEISTFLKTKIYFSNPNLKIEINNADFKQLLSLLGSKEKVYALLNYRKKLGGFLFKSQFSEVKLLSDSDIQNLNSNCSIDTEEIKRIDLSRASYHFLRQHPYLTRDVSTQIIQLRKKFSAIDLNLLKSQCPSFDSRIIPYLDSSSK